MVNNTVIALLRSVKQAARLPPSDGTGLVLDQMATQVGLVATMSAPMEGIDRYELMEAAEECAACGHVALVRALLSFPVARGFDKHYSQALRMAALWGRAEVAQTVISAWGDIPDPEWDAAAAHARYGKHEELSKWFATRGGALA